MTNHSLASTVRILDQGGGVAGAGFLVSDRRVLTCAHVVTLALGLADDPPNPPTSAVCLDFPLLTPGQPVWSRVVDWRPSDASPRQDGSDDIAVLELDGDCPAGARSAILVITDELWGHSFRAFGFPAAHDSGVWASGILRDRQADGWIQVEDINESGYVVAPGFSGTPVWDEHEHGVVGMIVAADRQVEVRAGFMIPASVLSQFISGPNERAIVHNFDGKETAAPRSTLAAHGERRKRVFLSYKRNAQPDESVAWSLFQALSPSCEVFIDQMMPIGTSWAQRIEEELGRSDFLVPLLSANSVRSEMVQAEITTARTLAAQQGGRPAILPVRLAYRERFQYPLSAYLNHVNWAYWGGPEDTSKLIAELARAISADDPTLAHAESPDLLVPAISASDIHQPSPSAQLGSVEMPEGTMDPESVYYVVRESDTRALAAIRQPGVTLTIKGPRQMGKSSLLLRTAASASRMGTRVALLDFQLIDRAVLANRDLFFRQFCSWITDELNLEDRVEEFWRIPLGNVQRCTRYVGRYVLNELSDPVMLAIDETEAILESDFRSDFFAMLRNWHNTRASSAVWKRVNLVLVTSTEPYQLIENLQQSPFNVGETIELNDFATGHIFELNERHGDPLSPMEVRSLIDLVGGHPYLVRRALYLVKSGSMSVLNLFATAAQDGGPFHDHLRYHLFRLYERQELLEAFKHIINNSARLDYRTLFRLRSAGLVRLDKGVASPRCRLYAEYFKSQLS